MSLPNYGLAQKPKVFVSYHHRGDQAYYDQFSHVFSELYEIVEDHSLDREVDSDNADYVMRVIRQEYITGSSATIVLCGAATWGRKHVDWEIKATLDAQHGLIGVQLPTATITNNLIVVPDRLDDNVKSGYALWIKWNLLVSNPTLLAGYLQQARNTSTTLIVNSRQMRQRNAS